MSDTKKSKTPDAGAELANMQTTTSELGAAFVQEIDASWLKGVDIERIVPLADGNGVRGIFLGEGGPVEVTDPDTGEIRALGTWRIRVQPQLVIRILDSARLRSDLAKLATDGTVRVRVMRLGVKNTSRGRRVTDYVTGVEPSAFRFAWEMEQANGNGAKAAGHGGAVPTR